MGLLGLLASLGVAGVRLSVQSQAACELERTLSPALQQAGVSVDASSGGLVSVTAAEGGLSVTLLDERGALLGQRRFAVGPVDCGVVAQSVAMLIKAWLDLAPAPPRRRAPTPKVARPPPPAAPQPVEEAAPEVLPFPEEEAAPVEEVIAPFPEPVVAAPPVARVEVAAAPPPAAPRAERPLRTVAVQVSGGLGMDRQAMAHLLATVSVGIREPWGVAVDFGTESPRSTGLITAMFWGGGLWARRAFLFFDGSFTGLYTAVGAKLLALTASSFLGSRATRITGAFAAQVEWRQTIFKGLFASAAVTAQVRLWEERITLSDADVRIVDGPTPGTMVIPAASGSASIGVGWVFP